MSDRTEEKRESSWEYDVGAFVMVIVPLFGLARGEYAWWIWLWLAVGIAVLAVAANRHAG